MKETLNVFAAVLFVGGFVPYISAVVRGSAKPSKASWIIWASLDVLTAAAMYASGSLNGQIVGAAAGAWTVATLSLLYGERGWTPLDKICLLWGGSGIVLWLTMGSPLPAIITAMAVLAGGGMPTLIAAWQDPRREDRLAWTLFWLSCLCAVLAIPRWTLEDALQPLNFAAFDTAMMGILFLRPRPTT
ncbi:hypothetical protein HYS30_00790 [Candidatus Peregrinibacteria bacterium]|nr:hypothetical protein [Candidatus Peregrinibacteria bacterium]